MQFTKLRVSGFKSFVDGAEMVIEPGLTGVVGPNGCGKSNVVESLRWAMGETSAKQMRGSAMDDVIFSGTASRPARNVAEVTIALDNRDRRAPAPFNEFDDIEISRRIERENGSVYRVNGRDVRARDVQLLFADFATGARSSAIVSQGKIGSVIDAKPADRRRLLEEAAGITGLHSRRHEAELRLRAAENNLERVDDAVGGLESQLQGLKRQARQASRYRNLSGHIRTAEAQLLHLQWTEALARLETAKTAFGEQESAVADHTQAAATAATAQAEAAAALPDLRQAEAEAAAALQRLIIAREQLDADAARLDAERAQNRQHAEQTAQDLERERGLLDEARRSLAALTEERAGIEAESAGAGDSLAEAEAALTNASAAVQSCESDLTAALEAVAAADSRRGALRQQIADIETREQRLARQAEELEAERARVRAGMRPPAEVEAAATALRAAEEKLEAAREAHEAAEQAHDAARRTERTAREAQQGAERDHARLLAEREALTRILGDNESGFWPPLVDSVRVDTGFETALGAALGDDLTASLEDGAPTCWTPPAPGYDDPALPAGAKPLSEVVAAPEAMARRLNQIGIVEDAEQGKRLAGSLRPGQRLVSRDGGLWRWDGYSVAPGTPTAAATRLTQRNRLAALAGELDASGETTAAKGRVLLDAVRAVEAARDAQHEARDADRAAETAVTEARERHTQIAQAAAAADSRLAALEETALRIDGEREEARRAQNATQQALAEVADTEALRAGIEDQRGALAAARESEIVRRGARDALQRAGAERTRRLAEIDNTMQTSRQRSEAAEAHAARLEERAAAIAAEATALESRPAEIDARRNDLLTQIEGAEGRRRQTADALATGEARQGEADKRLKQTEAELAQAREGRVRAEGTLTQARDHVKAMIQRIAERLECRPEQVAELAGFDPEKPLPPEEDLERRLERLKRERDNMGPVNLRADLEAQEVAEKIAEMQAERDDLSAAIAKLRRGIAELNREGRARLLQSFEEVNAQFEQLFTRLFGGGRAFLKMIESDDPLEAGLEIMASPPGKRLQAMSLLSGGERALTALALLFAVFLTNPAPICILDEVDAPLDDINVDRFCSLVEEIAHSAKTRFIVITHHRMTMARMDRLYGVTMGEPGVSQLVSVDLGEAEEIRATA